MSEQAVAGHQRSLPSSTPAQAETVTGLDVTQPIPSLAPEKFIPVDRKDIIERVLDRLFEPAQRSLATEAVRYMCALRQAESAKSLDSLVELYDAFNPDDETVNLTEISAPERKLRLETLKARVVDLVVSANYNEIDKAALEKILEKASGVGFLAEVDLSEYDFHLLYYRGAIKDKILAATWKTLWLFERPVEVDAYRRLFLGLKLKPFEARVAELMQTGLSKRKAQRAVRRARNHQLLEGVSEHTLHLKIFRRIARSELQILFPNARIRFTLFDRLWLWIGSGGSTVVAIVMAALKFVALVVISPLVILITVGGAVGAIFRTVTSFFNTRTRYMAKLAKSLYFHNIGSNQSVLTLLTDEAEEEDIIEAVITYALLLGHGHRGLDAVKNEAEKFLKDEFDVDCVFDIEDGCDHLRKLGLIVSDAHGQLHYRHLEDAREHLIAEWQAVPAAA
ncbi:MAG: TMEM143 family protein [Rhodomicrobium sp.]